MQSTISKAFLRHMGGKTSFLLRPPSLLRPASNGVMPAFATAGFMTLSATSAQVTTTLSSNNDRGIHHINSNTNTIATRNFHTTPVASVAERRRRRRRGGGGGDTHAEAANDNNDEFKEHSAVTDPVEFLETGRATLLKIQAAVEPMKAVNDPFKVTLIDSQDHDNLENKLTIEVEAKWGSYVIELEHEEKLLMLRSPVSGGHTYFYSKKTHEWIDTVDHHSFEGIFVRDLIRHCRGLPDL